MFWGLYSTMQPDLFAAEGGGSRHETVSLADGAAILCGFALSRADALIAGVGAVARAAPFRHLETRGGGRMSVAMTNCGTRGWVSDRAGYRYTPHDPLTDTAWPEMPPVFAALAADAAAVLGFAGFSPEVCLVNRYAPGTRLGLHQDRDEGDRISPIVSVSLGLPAVFLWGGAERGVRPGRFPLYHGDVVVWGGPSRMIYHGIAPVAEGEHSATGAVRYNLTFRKLG